MVKKTTKKFQKHHLKRTIDQRKQVQKYKKKILGDKRKSANRGSAGGAEESDEAPEPSRADQILDKDTETFFGSNDGLDALQATGKKGKKAGKAGQAADGAAAFVAEDLSDDDNFTKFLDEEDQAALASDDDSAEASEDEEVELSDDDAEVAVGKKKAKKAADGREEVTKEHIAKWGALLADEKSLRALKRVVVAFRAAVNVGGDEEAAAYKYAIHDPRVYNDLVMLVLRQVPAVLQHHLPVSTSGAGKKTVDTATKKYKQLAPVLKSVSSSYLKLLGDLTDTEVLSAVLTSAGQLLPYFASHRRFIKQFVRSVVDVWSTSPNEHTRLAAWMVIKEGAETGDAGMLALCIKTTYAGMIKQARATSIRTMPLINLTKNTAAMLYGIDFKTSYQTAFDAIRQLAVHLRNSVVHKTKDSYKAVYNWQYIHSLDFWRRVLSLHCDIEKEALRKKDSPLRPLIYPLVQVMLGTMRLIPAAQYFPLRFLLIRSLIDLSRDTGVYIPLVPAITEILSSTTVTKVGKATSLKAFDFDHNIRASAGYLGTRVYQDGVGQQVVECLGEFFGLYAKSVALPELVVPAVLTLKRFARRSKNAPKPAKDPKARGKKERENYKFNKMLLEAVDKLEANAKYIQEKRKGVDFTPQDTRQVNAFLKDVPWEQTPLGQYLGVQREIREEKLRLLRESIKDDDSDAPASDDDGADLDELEDELESEDEVEDEAEAEEEAELMDESD
ncbi:Noc2p family-domain-containing protein [Dipodascopsis tothii]|uniref:Noc2p family-domain-containing protein n=1 Tax=Dipodascopsis tothii TaxID=44089 RepID=UPI0034CD8BA1